MSDTPRTDDGIEDAENVALYLSTGSYKWKHSSLVVPVELARQLERELSAMTADRDSWCDQADQRTKDVLEQAARADKAERELAEALAANAHLVECNKRAGSGVLLDAAHAQLAAANQRIRELTEWRPMESAPRDGREVRLHNSSVVGGVNTWAGHWVTRSDGSSAWLVWHRFLDDSQFTGWLPLHQ